MIVYVFAIIVKMLMQMIMIYISVLNVGDLCELVGGGSYVHLLLPVLELLLFGEDNDLRTNVSAVK